MAAFPGIGLTIIDADDVKLGEPLGAGGFGTVYKATHVNWGRVAVKRVSGVRMTEDHQKEAKRMLLSLTSPYLVRIMGLIKRPDGIDIVMELCSNGSLKTFEAKYMKCDCWSRKIKMIQDIALGMNFLHTLKPPIIHCDLKLENVFVGNGFEAKIGDLGLAVSGTKSRKKGEIAGTISHMPPETFEPDKEYDEAFDIYTFAITTYELTTGQDPWPQLGTYANEKLISVWVVNGHRPKLDVMPSDAPTEIVEIIKKCWVAEQKERPRFSNIVDTVRELFETKYEESLLEADIAISKQIKLVRESSQRKTESVDSGWESVEVPNPALALLTENETSIEKQNETATPKHKDTASSKANKPEKNVQTGSSTQEERRLTTLKEKEKVTPNGKETATLKERETLASKEEETATPNSDKSGNYPATAEVENDASHHEEEANSITTENNKDKDRDYTDVILDKGMKWKYKYSMGGYNNSLKWIDDQHLALCDEGCVNVYEVSATSSHLAYTVTSKKWKPLLGFTKDVPDVAVSESHPGHMFVICEGQPYVYQLRCQAAKKEEMRYKIPVKPDFFSRIAASGNFAIISKGSTITVCNLPYFTSQSTVEVGSDVYDISIKSDYLLLMHDSKIIVRYLTGDMTKELCRINLPDEYQKFKSVSIGNLTNGAMELYTLCKDNVKDYDNNGNVIKYILDETKEGPELQSKFVGRILKRCCTLGHISVSSNKMMTIYNYIYKLE